ncbi:capping complex subunit for YIEGIA [Brevibacillus borstelensis]|uniref:capping complex subunit for YIEGIA n=1 Tax=Brevibacillus borstelensis TaxID=45462 RepID=UPI0030C2B3D2
MAGNIMAIVTTKKEQVAGGAPIFAVEDKEKMQQTAFTLEKILNAMVHELNEDTLIIVSHK